MADAETFKKEFWSQVGFEQNESLFYEMEAGLITGVQVRFMTFLQAILTIVVGEDIVNWSSSKEGFLDDLLVDEELDRLQENWKSCPRLVGLEDKSVKGKNMTELLKKKQKDLLDRVPDKRKHKVHSLLLSCLWGMGKSFLRLKDRKTESDEKAFICKEIKDSIQVVRKLLHDVENAANEEKGRQANNYFSLPHHELKTKDGVTPLHFFLQRSLLFGTVLADVERSYSKISTFEIIDGVSQYVAEQLNIIERLIPRLNIMVVSEIIASFNWTTAKLLTVIDNIPMFERTFTDSAKCAKCHRNWVGHNFLIGDGNHDLFIEDANWVVKNFLKLRLQSTQTDDSKKEGAAREKSGLFGVFPGLDDYIDKTSTELLASCNQLNNMRKKNEMLEKDNTKLTEKNTKLTEKNTELTERNQKLSEERENAIQQLNEADQNLQESNQRVAYLTEQVKQLQAAQLPTELSQADTVEELPQPASVPSTSKPVKSLAEGREMLQDVEAKPARGRNRRKKKTPSSQTNL